MFLQMKNSRLEVSRDW